MALATTPSLFTANLQILRNCNHLKHMKNLLITLVFIVATVPLVMAQTAKAPAKKPAAAQTPAESLTAQPATDATDNNNRTRLPNKMPSKSATGSGGKNATKLPNSKIGLSHKF